VRRKLLAETLVRKSRALFQTHRSHLRQFRAHLPTAIAAGHTILVGLHLWRGGEPCWTVLEMPPMRSIPCFWQPVCTQTRRGKCTCSTTQTQTWLSIRERERESACVCARVSLRVVYVHMCALTRVCACVRVDMCVDVRVCVLVCVFSCVYMRACAYMYAWAYMSI